MQGAGKTPKWQEIFDIDVNYTGDDEMILVVLDENNTESDMIGKTKIKLSALCVNGGLDEWFPIFANSKQAGQVHLKGTWKPIEATGVEQPVMFGENAYIDDIPEKETPMRMGMQDKTPNSDRPKEMSSETVQPEITIIIEYCILCSRHQWNTRHDEAKYADYAQSIA